MLRKVRCTVCGEKTDNRNNAYRQTIKHTAHTTTYYNARINTCDNCLAKIREQDKKEEASNGK